MNKPDFDKAIEQDIAKDDEIIQHMIARLADRYQLSQWRELCLACDHDIVYAEVDGCKEYKCSICGYTVYV
jgi:hypothetical protein